MHAPVIAILGRANVGKSTLFNKILGTRRAIVEDFAGVTRDRHYAMVDRYEIPFYLVDTGGFEVSPADEMSQAVVEQTLLAMEEADSIIALFDGKAGLQQGDIDVVELLRRQDKPVIFAVNKCDGEEQIARTADFYSLGVPELHDVSALYGRKIKDLVQTVLSSLPDYETLAQEAREKREKLSLAEREAEAEFSKFKESLFDQSMGGEDIDDAEMFVEVEEGEAVEEEEPEMPIGEPDFAPVYLPGEDDMSEEEYERLHKLAPLRETVPSAGEDAEEEEEEKFEEPSLPSIRLAIIGRPNVGKSTLLNTLAGERRAITSPVAGTTRDSLDVRIVRGEQEYVVIDTAGLRRKGRISDKLEKYSTMRALSSLSECDVAVLLLDAVEGPTDQDEKIAGLACEQGKGLIIGVNKWDLIEKDHRTVQSFKEKVQQRFKFALFAPLVFLSAKSGRRAGHVLEAVRKVALTRMRRVSTGHLNRVLRRRLDQIVAPAYRGKPIKLYFANQIDVAPPTFLLFFNFPEHVHFSYLRAIRNTIRDSLGFGEVEIKLVPRGKKLS